MNGHPMFEQRWIQWFRFPKFISVFSMIFCVFHSFWGASNFKHYVSFVTRWFSVLLIVNSAQGISWTLLARVETLFKIQDGTHTHLGPPHCERAIKNRRRDILLSDEQSERPTREWGRRFLTRTVFFLLSSNIIRFVCETTANFI